MESTHPLSPGFEDCSSSEVTTPVSVQHTRPARVKKRKQSPVPALPIVVQLMEMGFPRRNIEFALKSLTGASGNASGLPGIVFFLSVLMCIGVRNISVLLVLRAVPVSCVCLPLGVEALVGWLLDHSDIQVTELSDADTVSDEYSDEEVVEDTEDAAYPVVSAFPST